MDAEKYRKLEIISEDISETISALEGPVNEHRIFCFPKDIMDRIKGKVIYLLKEERDTIERFLKETKA